MADRPLTDTHPDIETLGIAYHVGGSLASVAHGVARTNIDADVIADLRPAHHERE